MQSCPKRGKLLAILHDIANGGESPIETKDRLPPESGLFSSERNPGGHCGTSCSMCSTSIVRPSDSVVRERVAMKAPSLRFSRVE